MRPWVAMVLVGCGRVQFVDSGSAIAELAIESPVPDADVQDTVALTGTCEDGVPVELGGAGLASPPVTSCDGTFGVEIVFTAGPGVKEITVSQHDAAGRSGTVTRTFNRLATSTAIAHVSSSAAATAGQGLQVPCNLVIARPPGVVDGDLLVGVIFSDASGGGTIDTTGWTRLSLSTFDSAAFYRIAAGEPASYMFAIGPGGPGGTCESAGAIAAFSNARAAGPIAIDSANTGTTSSLVATGVTSPAASVAIAAFGANGPATGIVAPAGMTTDAMSSAATTWGAALVAWQPIGSGPTGDRTATIAMSRDSGAALIVLEPGP